MAKPGAKKEMHNASTVFESMGTDSTMVKKVTDTCITTLMSDRLRDKIVIAEDKNGLYLTVKSIIDTHLLDGYRMYQRENITVTAGENDTYIVTMKNGTSITL